MSDSAARKISAARTNLVLDAPFWGALVLRLKPVATTSVPMGATDGEHFYYNPAYIDSIPMKEVEGLAAEEVAHCAFGHMWRRNGREHERWNVACDYALAGILKASGFDTGDMIYDAQWEGKSAEWIFERLPQAQQQQGGSGQQKAPGRGQQPGQGKGRGQAPGQQGGQPGGREPGKGRVEVMDARPDAPEEASESSWQQAVQAAAAAAKQRGSLPAGIERFVKDAVAARVDWRSVLHRFVQQVARADYRWVTPSRRYLARGLYMPSLYSESVGPIVIGVDTSGSIDVPILRQFAAEIRSIVDEVKPERVHVIYCDAKVHGVETFEQGDVVMGLKAKGGGGTAFAPAIDKAEELEEAPACMIYLTDLMGSHRAEEPDFPMLWVSISDPDGWPVPYGEVVVVR